MSDGRLTKTCPDCAEKVLAAARKCRFCGYRFDAISTPLSRPASGGLLGLLRGEERSSMSVPQLLDHWGIPYDEEEAPPVVLHGSVSGVFGFIVVTQTRFFLVPLTKASAAATVVEERFLRDLLRVHMRRHRMRRALCIEWRDARTIVESAGDQLAALYDLLSPHVLSESRDERQWDF